MFDEYEYLAREAKALVIHKAQITPDSQRLHENEHTGAYTHIFAPGSVVISTGNQSNDSSATHEGTSQAAPVTTGVILLMQEYYVRKRGHLPTVKELVGWLRRILAANLVDLVRRYCGAQRRDVRLERRLADEVDQSSRDIALVLMTKDSSPSQRAVRREQAVLLADALKSLPEDYDEVIVLHHLQGLNFPEVARRMERSVDSVKKLWIRALARLRDALGGSV